MIISLTENHRYYTAEGRIILLFYKLPNNTYAGAVTKTRNKGGEIITMSWSLDGKCITNSRYDIISTLNYRELAGLINVTYDFIRIAYNSGKLNITPAFTNSREAVFHEQDVLNLLNSCSKNELRTLIVNANKKVNRANYERKINKKLSTVDNI
jgi:hypothetical protein